MIIYFSETHTKPKQMTLVFEIRNQTKQHLHCIGEAFGLKCQKEYSTHVRSLLDGWHLGFECLKLTFLS